MGGQEPECFCLFVFWFGLGFCLVGDFLFWALFVLFLIMMEIRRA